jgi:hypothetical protein
MPPHTMHSWCTQGELYVRLFTTLLLREDVHLLVDNNLHLLAVHLKQLPPSRGRCCHDRGTSSITKTYGTKHICGDVGLGTSVGAKRKKTDYLYISLTH